MAFNRTLNVNNVKDSPEYKPLPAGEYSVKIVKAEDCISRNTGKDMIKLEFDVLDGPFAAKLWQYIIDDQYADQKVANIFRSAGKTLPQQIHSGIFLGLQCRVKTRMRVYNGEEQAEIHYFVNKTMDPSMAPAPAPTKNATDDIPF